MTVSNDFKEMLEKRYGSSEELDPPVHNARRVNVQGIRCVAKLINYALGENTDVFNRRRKAGFAMEKYAYRNLTCLPVSLVETFSSRSGQTFGHVVVTTEYPNTSWSEYKNSDETVARRLIFQVKAIHQAGIAHGDLLLKNILFQPPHGVAIIDFEKSMRCKPGADSQHLDWWCLIETLLFNSNTRGIAFCILRGLPDSLAKKVFAQALENLSRYPREQINYEQESS